MSVTIVVPCFNEAKRFDFAAFAAALHDPSLQLIFVDDGSTDDTLSLLRAFAGKQGERVEVLALPRNGGKAEAVRQGMLQALGGEAKLIGFWDADLATPLDEIPRFLEVLKNNSAVEMVFGSRVKLMGRDIRRRARRHYLGRVAATAISNVLKLAIYDTQCGAKIFRADELSRRVFERPFSTRWIFDVEIIARYVSEYRSRGEEVADRIYELPLLRWRDVDGSKVRALDFLRAGGDLWKISRLYKL